MKAKLRNAVLCGVSALMLAVVPLATSAITDVDNTVTANAATVNHADIPETQNLAHNKWDWSFDQTGAGKTTYNGDTMRMSEISVNDGPYAMYQTNRMDNFKYSMYANMSLKTSGDLVGVPSTSTEWDYSTFYISFMVTSGSPYAKYANAMTAETYQNPYFSICFERNYLTQRYCADCAEGTNRTIDSSTGTCKTCHGTNFTEDKKMLDLIRLYRNEGCFGGTADDRIDVVEKTWFEGIEDYIGKDFDFDGDVDEKDVQASDVGVNYIDGNYHWFDFEVQDVSGGIKVSFYYDGVLMFEYTQSNTFEMRNGTSKTVRFDQTTGWIGLWTHSSLSPQPSSITDCYVDIKQLGIAPITGSSVGSYYEKCSVPDLPIKDVFYPLEAEYLKGEPVEIKLSDLFTYEGDEEIVYEFVDDSTGAPLGTQRNGYWYWTPVAGDFVSVKVTATVQNGNTANPKKATNYLDFYLSGEDVQQLSAPTITIDKTGGASWSTVSNATGYIYKIGENGTETEATKNSAQLTDGETLYVKATGFGYIDSDWAMATYTAPALDAPKVTLTGRIATWKAVENAENGYAYTINGGEQQTTTATFVRGLKHGETLRVKALGNGTTTRDSAWSAGVTYMASVLPAPTVKIKDGLASWEMDENASGYVYKIGVDGEEKEATTASVTLTHGETIYVKAIGDGEGYLSSNWSAPQTYSEGMLNTPVVTLNGNVVSWEADEEASGYVYKIGVNGKEEEATGLSITLKHGETVKVKAVGEEKEDSYWSEAITYVAPTLDVPTVTLNENVASWTADENASGYVYKIGANGEVKNATGTSVTLKNGETVYVKALGNGETTLDSAWSKAVSYEASALSAPVVQLNGNVASWTADEDASGYVYKIGATGEVKNATGTSVTLKNGETIYVKALGDGETTLDSAWSGGKKYVYVKPGENPENPGENPENPGETPENPDDGNKPSVDPEMEGVYTGSGEKSGCGSIAGAFSGAMTMLVAGLVVALKRRGE